MKRFGAPAFKKHSVSSRGIDLGASLPLHVRVSADMIVMRMTGQNNLDVLQPESKRGDVGANDRWRLFKAGVEQDMPRRGRHQITSQVIGADVIDVADDPKRFEWLV